MTDRDLFEEAAKTLAAKTSQPAKVERWPAQLRLPDGRIATIEQTSTLGSAPAVDLRIEEPTVSRLHARLEPRDDGLWIIDLDSTNGTFVEGVRVTGALLHDGARIALGGATLEVRYLEKSAVALYPAERFGPLVGRSAAMRELFQNLERVAASDATVLVQGETGTGKELVARAIHEASPRAKGPFVVFDCGAVTESLFEAELFGHAKGAFTGADRAREGAAGAAAGGTLFLDEVGELPLAMQPKILRMLESRTVRRVGESAHRSVDLRVIAATHRDVARMVAAGSFREDLYFRLAVLPLVVPPLRMRRDDLGLLASHFLGGRALDPDALREIEGRPWLGNVRELRSFVERAVALGTAQALKSVQVAPTDARNALPPPDLDRPFKTLRDEWNEHLERAYLAGWLERKAGNVSAVADAIGLDRTYVHRLLKKHGLTR